MKFFYLRKFGTSQFVSQPFYKHNELIDHSVQILTSGSSDEKQAFCPICNKYNQVTEFKEDEVLLKCSHKRHGIMVEYPVLSKDKDDEIDFFPEFNYEHDYEYNLFNRAPSFSFAKLDDYGITEYKNKIVKLNEKNFYDDDNIAKDFLGIKVESNCKQLYLTLYFNDREKFEHAENKKALFKHQLVTRTFCGVLGQNRFREINYPYDDLLRFEDNYYDYSLEIADIKWPENLKQDISKILNEWSHKNLTFNTSLTGIDFFEGICKFPYEPNFLHTYKHTQFYIPDCPSIVNEYLESRNLKAFTSLRKLFQTDTMALLKYEFALQLGLKDPNIIITFISNSNSDKLFTFAREKNNEYNRYYCIEFSIKNYLIEFVKNMLAVKSEKNVANFLIKMNPDYSSVDCLRMYHDYYDCLTPEFKKDLYREGFTPYNHDVLAKISYHGQHENVEIPYSQEELSIEDDIDGYTFKLPKETDTLYDIGQAMHNCVASYYHKALEKKCVIVYVMKDDKFNLCIEIINKRAVQELGYRNTHPNSQQLSILNKWHNKHGIFI